jgi:mono/diheme cytochrome c family protein
MAGSPQQLERGEQVYQLFCGSCHDSQGKGTGVANARNFTTLEDWKNNSKISTMYRTLENGLGDKMPSFQHLKPDDRFAVIHYVRDYAVGHPADAPAEIAALDQEFSLAAGRMPKPELPIPEAMARLAEEAAVTEALPVLSDEELARLRQVEPRGAALFANNCASCHGDRGQGAAMMHTLDEAWNARITALALNAPDRSWRNADAEALRVQIGKISISTGGLKPSFGSFAKEDWRAVHAFALGLTPTGELEKTP